VLLPDVGSSPPSRPDELKVLDRARNAKAVVDRTAGPPALAQFDLFTHLNRNPRRLHWVVGEDSFERSDALELVNAAREEQVGGKLIGRELGSIQYDHPSTRPSELDGSR
jgi:hypothetical protein